MKEQWKKLDSDAKLLVNVEEGKALPIKIELPLSALIPNREDNFKRLLNILRIVFLLFLLLLLSFSVTLLYTRYYSRSNIEFNKEALVDLEPGLDSEANKLAFKNKVHQELGDEIKSNDVDLTTPSVQESISSDVSTDQSSNEKILPEVFVIKMTEAQPPSDIKWFTGNHDVLAATLTQAINELAENQSGMPLGEAIVVTQNGNEEIKEFEPTDSLGTNENLSDVTNVESDITDLFGALLFDFAQLAQENIGIGNIGESNELESTVLKLEGLQESEVESTNNDEDVSKNNEEETEESDNEYIPEQNINSENSEEQGQMTDITQSLDSTRFESMLDLLIKNKVLSSEEKTSISEEGVDTVFVKQAFFIAVCLEDIVGKNHELLNWYIYEYNQDVEDTDDNINDRKKLYAAKALYNWDIEEYEKDLIDLVDQLATLKYASRYAKFMADSEEYNRQPSELQNYIFKRLMVKSDLDKYFKKHPTMSKEISSALYYLNTNELATSISHSSSNKNSATSAENKVASNEIVSETTTVENINSYEVFKNEAIEDSSENSSDEGDAVTKGVTEEASNDTSDEGETVTEGVTEETSNDTSDEEIGTTVVEEHSSEDLSDDGTSITKARETVYDGASSEGNVNDEHVFAESSYMPVWSAQEDSVLAAMQQVARFDDDVTSARNSEENNVEDDPDDSTTYDNKLDSFVQTLMAVLDEYNEDETSEAQPAQNLSEDNVPEESVDVEEAKSISELNPVPEKPKLLYIPRYG